MTTKMIPRIPSRKKGDAYTAKDQQRVARAINSLANGKPETFTEHGNVYETPPFEPIIYNEGSSLYVKISETKKGNAGHKMGRVEWSTPHFEGGAIINPDPLDGSWNPPKKSLTAGDWEMFLVEGVAATEGDALEIIVQQEGDADPESKPPWKNVYKLATWTVSTVSGLLVAEDIESSHTTSIQDKAAPFAPFYPVLWHDGSVFKARFTPAQVLHYKDGTSVDVTIESAAMDASAGVTVADGDEFWLQVETDNMGTPSYADLQKTSSQTTTQFQEPLNGSGTDGDYWFKVCQFDVDTDGRMIPTMDWTGNLPWNPRPWENVGTGEEVIKDFAAGKYEARTLKAKDADPGTSTTASGDTSIYDVFVKPEKNGDVIEFSGKVEIPDAGGDGLPTGSAGDMLYHNGVAWVVLASPAAPGADTVNILTHSGAAPVWVNKAIEEINVCVSGSPATWNIIKM